MTDRDYAVDRHADHYMHTFEWLFRNSKRFNPFVTYNVHRASTFLCQDAVPMYAVRPKITGFQR